jgi:hypothetical protein
MKAVMHRGVRGIALIFKVGQPVGFLVNNYINKTTQVYMTKEK